MRAAANIHCLQRTRRTTSPRGYQLCLIDATSRSSTMSQPRDQEGDSSWMRCRCACSWHFLRMPLHLVVSLFVCAFVRIVVASYCCRWWWPDDAVFPEEVAHADRSWGHGRHLSTRATARETNTPNLFRSCGKIFCPFPRTRTCGTLIGVLPLINVRIGEILQMSFPVQDSPNSSTFAIVLTTYLSAR